VFPKIISYGDFFLPTYGVMVALAFLAALWMIGRLGREAGLPSESLMNLGIYCALAGMLGAKLMMFAFDWQVYWNDPKQIFSRETLQAMGVYQGGLILAVITAIVYMRRMNLPPLLTSDVFAPGLDLNSSITWTDSKIDRNDKFPASVGKWQPRIPRWRATCQASYRASPRLTLTVAARYSGRQYTTLDNSDPNGFAYQGTSRYFTSDVRATYRLDRQWLIAFGIDNLNNYKYWNFHPYPQRTYAVELKFDL